jgi:acyl-CoA thioester hydrolase
MRRKKKNYFKTEKDAPAPLEVTVKHRVSFSEVDAMAVAWHGRYPKFFEMALEELSRRIGMSYREYFEAGLRGPIVQLHFDYHTSVVLEEEISITAKLIWNEAARLDTEYTITKEDGITAATGYTVQMFVDGHTGEPCITVPELLETCQARWQDGDFKDLQ